MSMPMKCPLCEGWGFLDAAARRPLPDPSRSGLTCHGCHGRGWITVTPPPVFVTRTSCGTPFKPALPSWPYGPELDGIRNDLRFATTAGDR